MRAEFAHEQAQTYLRQRNRFAVLAGVLGLTTLVSLGAAVTRDEQVVLVPITSERITVSSGGIDAPYLELVTRDTAVLTLNRSPGSLDYWMKSVLAIVSPRAQGTIKADLLKIVNEQRNSSMSQFFTLEGMEIDAKHLQSTVTGKLSTVVGQKIVSSEPRTFIYDWEYSGMSLKLVGFSMAQPKGRLGGSL